MSAELHRRLENLIRFGTIKTIHPAKPFTTVTVTIGAITTAKLRYISLRAGKTIRIFEDGCLLSYDIKTHQLDAVLPEGGTFNVTADVNITGKLTVSETITAEKDISTSADVIAGNISLKKHKTDKVQPGNGQSGGPIP